MLNRRNFIKALAALPFLRLFKKEEKTSKIELPPPWNKCEYEHIRIEGTPFVDEAIALNDAIVGELVSLEFPDGTTFYYSTNTLTDKKEKVRLPNIITINDPKRLMNGQDS